MKASTAIKILNLKDSFSLKELKSAYRKLASKNHPDHGGDLNKMQLINESYDLLVLSLNEPLDIIEDETYKAPDFNVDIFFNYSKFTAECVKFYFNMFKF